MFQTRIFRTHHWLFAIATIALSTLFVRAQEAKSCAQAHAHNDYLHKRPLLDALDAGFCSVEADIFLVDGTLLVAHTRAELSPDRTLRSLYLEPLKARIQKNAGRVHRDVPTFNLLIDIKSEGDSTYRALHSLLSEYNDLVSYVDNGKEHPGPVTAIVSGNRAVDLIAAEKVRYLGIDGRLTDLESETPSHMMPLISDNWASHFKWRGNGEIPKSDKEKMATIIESVHKKKRLVRFWGTPDSPTAWAVFKEAGIDLINTDNLEGLSAFLQNKPL